MGKFNHSRAGSSTTNSCRCEEIEKKLNEAKKKLKKVFAKLDKLKKAAAKKIAKKVATLPLKAVPILGWAMAAYDVYDVVTTGIDIADVIEEFNKEAGIVNKLSDKLDGCLGKKKQTGNGGAHRDMQKPKGDGKDSHHMPDRNADPSVHPNDGTAIKMDPKDHKETSSHGNKGNKGKQYRAENKKMIEEGRKRDVYAREIKDARNAAHKGSGDRRKYNEGIEEMLDYGKKTRQVPPKK